QRSATRWRPPEPDWRTLIESLLEQSLWDDSVAVMRDYIRELDNPSPRVRLKLAQILIQKLGRPLRALRILDELPEDSLPDGLATMRRQPARQAKAMQEAAPLDLDDEK